MMTPIEDIENGTPAHGVDGHEDERRKVLLAPETVNWRKLIRDTDTISEEYARREDIVEQLAVKRDLSEEIVDKALVNHALHLGLLEQVAEQDVLYVPREVPPNE